MKMFLGTLGPANSGLSIWATRLSDTRIWGHVIAMDEESNITLHTQQIVGWDNPNNEILFHIIANNWWAKMLGDLGHIIPSFGKFPDPNMVYSINSRT